MNRLLTIFAAILLLLTGCNSTDEISEDRVPKEVNEYAKNFLDKLVVGDINYCFSQLDSQFQDDKAKKFFENSYDSLKDNELKNSSIIYYRSTTIYGNNPMSKYEFEYEYEYVDFWVYYTFILQEKEGKFTVYSFNISPFENSLRQLHQFTFKDKGLIHYFFFFMVISVPLFILVSIGFSIMTPLKRKWLWIIFMLIGIVSFNLNWTDGQWSLQLIRFKLLGAGFIKTGIIAPWIFSFAIPVGAIIFWFKRAQIRKELESQEVLDTNEIEKK